jgi:hypothetical protein
MSGLYTGESNVAVILVSGILGGGASWLTGRAIARAWHPAWHVIVAAVFLAAAARFLHFALFEGQLISVPSFCLDTLICLAVGLLAWRTTRATQMVRQYPWLYTRAGPLNWRENGREST